LYPKENNIIFLDRLSGSQSLNNGLIQASVKKESNAHPWCIGLAERRKRQDMLVSVRIAKGHV
jgi:hypothetical protein